MLTLQCVCLLLLMCGPGVLSSLQVARLQPTPPPTKACPGLYCGQHHDPDTGNLTDCGACPRGSRPDDTSMCQPCHYEPTFYDWLYLGFMALLAPALHCFFIDLTNKSKAGRLLVLHVCGVVECVCAGVCALLLVAPVGRLAVTSCRVAGLADWYTMLYNPSPDYISTLHCTVEAVYPLYSLVLIYYALALVAMMLLRPLLSAYLLARRGTASIYAALYFFPILMVLHAVLAGLLYYSFPYIVLVVSVVTNAAHLASFRQQSLRHLVTVTVTDPRNLLILLCHWAMHAYGIVAVTQLAHPAFHAPLLALVPFPTIFYLLTVKFTDPNKLEQVN